MGLSRLISASLLFGVLCKLDVRSMVSPSPDATDTEAKKKKQPKRSMILQNNFGRKSSYGRVAAFTQDEKDQEIVIAQAVTCEHLHYFGRATLKLETVLFLPLLDHVNR